MRQAAWILLLPVLVGLLCLPAHGAAAEGQEQIVDIEKLEHSAEENGGTVDYGVSLEEGLIDLWSIGKEELGGIVKRGIRSGVILLLILLLCGIADCLQEGTVGGGLPAVPLAGSVGIAAVAATDVGSLLGLGKSAIEGMAGFAEVLLPTVAAVTAATGAITGAAVRQVASVFFCDLLVHLISGLLIPLLYGYIALSVGWSATGNEGLDRLSKLLKWGCTTVLTVVMLAFVSYLSFSGVVAGSADAVTLKAAKFAISSTVPVIGGILADAADSILASAGILKGTVGVFGAVTVLGICLVPLLRMGVHYLVYKLVSALAGTMGSDRVYSLVDRLGGAFGLLMGMTGACCLLLLIAMVTSAAAVSV